MKKEVMYSINETRLLSHAHFLCVDYHFQALELHLSSNTEESNHPSFVQQFYNDLPLPSYLKKQSTELFPLKTSFEFLKNAGMEYLQVYYQLQPLNDDHKLDLPSLALHISFVEESGLWTYSYYLSSYHPKDEAKGRGNREEWKESEYEFLLPVLPQKDVTISIDIA